MVGYTVIPQTSKGNPKFFPSQVAKSRHLDHADHGGGDKGGGIGDALRLKSPSCSCCFNLPRNPNHQLIGGKKSNYSLGFNHPR